MKTKTIGLTLSLFLAISALCLASPMMGTWKLNEAKSKMAPGAQKNMTVVYTEAAGGMIKITTSGVDKDGKPSKSEWTGKFDGKEYPVTSDSTVDMRSYKQVDPSTLDLINKKSGKVIMTGRIVVSADGKTRTVTTTSSDSAGKQTETTLLYDKQ
ncbi:MAG: hypothetical protein ACJ8M4_09720 [Chthoniobacterales bacterium]